jgi:hypothetical protein
MAVKPYLPTGGNTSSRRRREPARVKLELLGLIDRATVRGWSQVRACGALDLSDVAEDRLDHRLAFR